MNLVKTNYNKERIIPALPLNTGAHSGLAAVVPRDSYENVVNSKDKGQTLVPKEALLKYRNLKIIDPLDHLL